MGGPEWGRLSVDGREPISGAASEVTWSDTGTYLAFVKLHDELVPNRKGAEGLSFRVAVMRMSDYEIRYCLGNRKLAEIKLQSMTDTEIRLRANGETKTISVKAIEW
jgi:hypothetical protein